MEEIVAHLEMNNFILKTTTDSSTISKIETINIERFVNYISTTNQKSFN